MLGILYKRFINSHFNSSSLNLYRHIPFLRAVFEFSLTAFGGPQGHLGMMIKTFSEKRKDVTEKELLEYNAFCQMLPGPSSSQTIMLIGLKRGGTPLALMTLLIWLLPASILMGTFAFILAYLDAKEMQGNVFSFVQPMSVGFIAFAGYRMMKTSVKHKATIGIMLMALLATVFIQSPWVFPIILLVSGLISNISNKRIPNTHITKKPIKWMNIWLFFAFFLLVGFLSEMARINNWEYRRLFNMAENFYRFGSFVFGGGQALLPLMLYQFVKFPITVGREPWLSAEELMTGYGIVNAMPGPVFSLCSFVGSLAMRHFGTPYQILGSLVAITCVFLPSTLLVLFLFPLYNNLKQHVIIYRALEGIHAAIVGIILASGIVLFQAVPFLWTNVVVVLITFSILAFTKIPSPYIVLGWLLLGWAMHS